jgi:hypothetical protein
LIQAHQIDVLPKVDGIAWIATEITKCRNAARGGRC